MTTNQEYDEIIQHLFAQVPAFHNIGAAAYKPGLETITALCHELGDPQTSFRSIHVAGTNGKGSTCHSLASVLQASGAKTGLFTSPHLVDFRERIRINGQMISREEVIDFMHRTEDVRERLSPSFFEITTAMAFDHFARHCVDIAVIETGLGGRLDSTNILRPILSIITNISLDHTELLGDTLAKIAAEKAGIIKFSVPAVIGEARDPEVREVFVHKAEEVSSPITFVEDEKPILSYKLATDHISYHTREFGDIICDLCGDCQPRNMATVLLALTKLNSQGSNLNEASIKEGLSHVAASTGLMGRWMTLPSDHRVIVDTGHNEGCWSYLAPRLAQIRPLTAILGFCADKDVATILKMLPSHGYYIFTAADTKRAMEPSDLAALCRELRPDITSIVTAPSVIEAYLEAQKVVGPKDTIFVGGSTFVVADLLKHQSAEEN